MTTSCSHVLGAARGRASLLLTAAVVALVVVAGCAQSTITFAEADRRVTDLVRGVAGVIGDPARLDERAVPAQICQEGFDNEATGQSQAGRDAVLDGLALPDVRRSADDVRRHLEQENFRQVSRREAPGAVFDLYRNDTDQFRVSVNLRTDLASIGASSPCVWPNGTPP